METIIKEFNELKLAVKQRDEVIKQLKALIAQMEKDLKEVGNG